MMDKIPRFFIVLLALSCRAFGQTFINVALTGLGTGPGAVLVLQGCEISGPVYCENAKSVTIRNCNFNLGGQFGILIVGGCPIVLIEQNEIQNAYCGIEINSVQNDPNVTISWNQIVSGPTNNWNDQISIQNSSGTIGRSIIIDHCYVQIDPTSPHVENSGGIVPGDVGDYYVTSIDNILVGCNTVLWYDNQNTSKIVNNRVSGSFSNYTGIAARSGYVIGNIVDWTNGAAYYLVGVGGAANNATSPLTDLWWQWQTETVAYGIHIGP